MMVSMEGRAAADGAVQRASAMEQNGRVEWTRLLFPTMMMVHPDEDCQVAEPYRSPPTKEGERD